MRRPETYELFTSMLSLVTLITLFHYIFDSGVVTAYTDYQVHLLVQQKKLTTAKSDRTFGSHGL